MQISTLIAAKIIYEAGRALAAKKKNAEPTLSWEEQSPAFRDDRTTEVMYYLNTGEVGDVATPELFKAVVDAAR